MKYIHAADMLPALEAMADLMRKLDQSGGRDYLEILLQYALSKGDIEDDGAFFDLIRTKISPDSGGNVMTLAQRLEQRGRMQGREEGFSLGRQNEQFEVARSMLADDLDPGMISKYTRLPLEQVEALAKTPEYQD